MKERLISAFVALLITVPLLLLGGIYFNILVTILGVLGLKELLDIKKDIPNEMKLISYILFVLLLLYGYTYTSKIFMLNYTLLLICILVLLSSIITFHNVKKYSIEDVFYLFSSIVILSAAFNLFIVVRASGLNYIVYLLLITIITDTFAFFIGGKYGKRKLMVDVSPNKTIEGFIAGCIFGTLLPTLFYVFVIDSSNILLIVVLTFILSIIGQVGDLVFSAIKRNYKIKDFSNIMPGHGGILDRLDSIIFVLFMYLIFTTIL